MSEGGSDEAEPKSERFNMFISKSEMEAIDKWAWENRVRSKSEAVRRLCQIGLIASAQLRPLLKKSESVLEALIDEAEEHSAMIAENGIDYAAIGALHLNSNLETTRLTGELYAAIGEMAALMAEFKKDATFEQTQENVQRLRKTVQEKAEWADRLYRKIEEDKP